MRLYKYTHSEHESYELLRAQGLPDGVVTLGFLAGELLPLLGEDIRPLVLFSPACIVASGKEPEGYFIIIKSEHPVADKLLEDLTHATATVELRDDSSDFGTSTLRRYRPECLPSRN